MSYLCVFDYRINPSNNIFTYVLSVDAIVKAETREQLQAATRSLDRVLWNSYFVVPHWYNPTHRIAFRKEMGYPNPPLYYSAESWILSTWWLQEARQRELKMIEDERNRMLRR